MKQKMFLHSTISYRKTVLVLIVFFSFTSLFSQRINPGIRVGTSLSNWNVKGTTDAESLSLISPEFGVFANIAATRSFSIEPGITYATIGSKLKYTDDKITYKLNYLQFPLLFKYRLSNGLSFFAGPQPGFLLKANGIDKLGDKQSVKTALVKNDFSFLGGVQYNFPFGIGIAVKYMAGLTDIIKADDVEVKNYSFGLNLSYQFQVSKRK